MPTPREQGYEQGFRMARELEHLRRRVDRVVSNKKNPYTPESKEHREFEAGYREGMRSKPDES